MNGSCLDDIFRLLGVYLFLDIEHANDIAALLFISLFLSVFLIIRCIRGTGYKLLNFTINCRIHLPFLTLLGSRAVIHRHPLGTVICNEGVIVVVVKDWIHDLVDGLYLSKHSRTVSVGDFAGDGVVDLADVLGEDYVEVYDVLELVGVIAADCVDDLLEGTHHLYQV